MWWKPVLEFLGKWFSIGLTNLLHVIESLGREEWILILIIITVAGFFMLQGFGSRKKY